MDAQQVWMITAPPISKSEPLKGIAGWLVIPAIGLVFSPILSTARLFLGWQLVQITAPELANDPRLWLSMLLDGGLILFAVVVAILFFRKRRAAISSMVALLIAAVAAGACQAALNAWMFGDIGIDGLNAVIRPSIYAAIWVPYFKKSERVRNTFSEPVLPEEERPTVRSDRTLRGLIASTFPPDEPFNGERA